MAKTTYPISVIARLLDLTERRVQQLTKEGMIPKSERGRYDLVMAVRGYIHFLRDRALGKDGDALPDIALERGRLLKAQADAAEMENARTRGEFLPKEFIRKSVERAVIACRARLLAMPDKAATQVVACSSIPEVKDLLQREVYEALDELARADYSGCVEVGEGDPAGGDGALPPAASLNGEPVGGPVPQA
ncbi:MAG: terminase small subunit, Nu1 [bacterium]|jgi:phage terminase Nu1 subunit (DNA packaging protein)